jgi:hypothetical protein
MLLNQDRVREKCASSQLGYRWRLSECLWKRNSSPNKRRRNRLSLSTGLYQAAWQHPELSRRPDTPPGCNDCGLGGRRGMGHGMFRVADRLRSRVTNRCSPVDNGLLALDHTPDRSASDRVRRRWRDISRTRAESLRSTSSRRSVASSSCGATTAAASSTASGVSCPGLARLRRRLADARQVVGRALRRLPVRLELGRHQAPFAWSTSGTPSPPPRPPPTYADREYLTLACPQLIRVLTMDQVPSSLIPCVLRRSSTRDSADRPRYIRNMNCSFLIERPHFFPTVFSAISVLLTDLMDAA